MPACLGSHTVHRATGRRTTENDDFETMRRYTRQEAADNLRINDRWLKEWVTDGRVPHQRKGKVRGVWSTYDDIHAIGRMLPALMTRREANGRARATEGPSDQVVPDSCAGTQGTAQPPSSTESGSGRAALVTRAPSATATAREELLARFSGLRAVRAV